MEEDRIFPKLDLKQFFMHPRKQSNEQFSDSSTEIYERKRHDSYDDLCGKNSWQKLLLPKDDKEASKTDINGNLINSSLIGKSQEQKFQPVKIENKSAFIVKETSKFFEINLPKPDEYRSHIPIIHDLTMAPVLNNLDFNMSYLSEFTLDYEDFKKTNEAITKTPTSYAPKQTFKELNRMSILEDAIALLENQNRLKEEEKVEMNAIITSKVRKLNSKQKHHSISKYNNKKQKRKSPAFIRYKIRQELAGTRIRNKGKFVRNERIDMKKLADEYMKGEFIRTSTTEQRV